MTTTIARVDESAPLAIRPGQEMWTDKQRAALAVLGIKDASNADLAVFMHYCQRTELDPFSRQIYYIKRREFANGGWVEKWTIQVGIDGFRVMRDRVAARTGCQVEFEDTVWFDAEGNEHKVWLSAEPPAACRVVLLKHQDGKTLRFPAVLRTAAYMATNKDGNPVAQWKAQAEHMIEKCCEAFSTRRAFPNDFSGVFIPEEMNGRDGAEPAREVRRVKPGDILVGRQGAEVLADHMGPADEVVEGELVDEPDASDQGAKQEPPPPAATVRTVNDQFTRLGYTVRDAGEVNKTIAAIAGRGLPVKGAKDLDPGELQVVHDRLAACAERGDVVALMAQIAESKGTDPDSEPADG